VTVCPQLASPLSGLATGAGGQLPLPPGTTLPPLPGTGNGGGILQFLLGGGS
jgi:hypothetical protein